MDFEKMEIALCLLRLKYGNNYDFDQSKMNQGRPHTHLGNENVAPDFGTSEDSSGDSPMDLSPKLLEESSTDTSDGPVKTPHSPVSRSSRLRKNKMAERKRRSNLPKNVVEILSAWLDENRYYAYPSETTKQEMAGNMGITVKQVNNWFINARRRKLDNLLQEEGKCANDYRITRKKKTCSINQARKTSARGKGYPVATSRAPSRPIQTPPTPCSSTSPSFYDSSTSAEGSVYEFRPISPIQRERTLDFESL